MPIEQDKKSDDWARGAFINLLLKHCPPIVAQGDLEDVGYWIFQPSQSECEQPSLAFRI